MRRRVRLHRNLAYATRGGNIGSMIPSSGRVCLCGAWLDTLSMSQVMVRVQRAVQTREPLAVSMVNVAKLVNMRRDRLLRESVESGDLTLADGMPLVWLSRLKPRSLPERVAGIDLMYELFRLADHHALRVFLLGARVETLRRVIETVHQRYPRMIIAGCHDGYFSDERQEEVACLVRQARPDILLVAMSSPKKELFMHYHRRNVR